MKEEKGQTSKSRAEKQAALKHILDNAMVTDGITDVFALAGLDKPDIGLLSDEFLEDVRRLPTQHLVVELLERLLKDEIRGRLRTNVVQETKYSDRLQESLRKYHNRAIETSQVIAELAEMAKELRAAMARNEALGLSNDEIAFYDALVAERPEVLDVMGDETLKKLVAELAEKLRNSTTVDWQNRESVRAKMRLLIKRLLGKYRYPPEGQEEAVRRVIEQTEVLCEEWGG